MPEEVASDENVIYVGKKNVMSYVLAVVTQFNMGSLEVHLKARGRAISRAADVTQIVKNRFIPSLAIKGINITTEELTSEDGRLNKVSSMDILMTK
ncbi:DNA-binding protein Alba [Candidatus Micrarchaeota archaeon]|nr:DNA-binding protein Alba [Candidatus Micrarchaeota archaeon]